MNRTASFIYCEDNRLSLSPSQSPAKSKRKKSKSREVSERLYLNISPRALKNQAISGSKMCSLSIGSPKVGNAKAGAHQMKSSSMTANSLKSTMLKKQLEAYTTYNRQLVLPKKKVKKVCQTSPRK